ncbi:hypothetical protein ATANTOWER_013213 [Ataeniobius toweri]|uniref:Uncharacterized protein n=1 Tax=Ataeniobius toweri TaxID=208326 RepID=A0ABU7BQB3_9TELE|nr:hypothetical protein [Ataeniobius toweri]
MDPVKPVSPTMVPPAAKVIKSLCGRSKEPPVALELQVPELLTLGLDHHHQHQSLKNLFSSLNNKNGAVLQS